MSDPAVFLCESCAPEGLRLSECATRPVLRVCDVCDAQAERWFTSVRAMMVALLQERKTRRLPAPDADDETLRTWWREHGGKFHGPNIETGTMPESVLLPLLRWLTAGKLA